MSNPYQSVALAPCYDGEPADEALPVEVTDTPTDETQSANPVTPVQPEPEPVVELLTPEQLEAKLAERDREWADKLSARDSEVATIKARYDQATVERTLSDAAIRGDAFNPEQILPILRSHTSIDASGNPVVQIENFVMTPQEAITWMRSQPSRFGNLFKTNVVGGLGGHSATGGARAGKHIDVKSLNAEEYRKVRRENPGALGLGSD